MKRQIKSLLCAGLMGAVVLSAHAQNYSNLVTGLHPVAYYPLNEVATPPAAVTLTATNYGTDTNLAMTYSGDVIFGNPSPLASQPADSSDFFNAGNSFASAPYDSTLSTQPPFTIEGWFLSRNISSTQCPTSDFDGNDNGNPGSRSGWLIYMDIANPGQYTFRAYNQNGNSPSLSFNIGAAGSIAQGTWYHLAVVVDVSGGTTNVTGYINGVPVSGPTALPSYVPNDGANGGLSVGCRSDIGFGFDGNVDELAYYSKALSAATILSHYQAATNHSPATPYDQLVLQQNPLAYYRFNEATPALSSDYPAPLPVAHNYGSLGASANGFFSVNSNPGGVAGPTNSGFGGLPALQLNPSGVASQGTAGPGVYAAPFTPDLFNETNAITVTFWAQASLATYFETIVGRGDGSWRFDIDPQGFPHWAASPNGDLVGSTSVADGNWHFWAGVYDPVSGNGTLYIDGAVVVSAPWAALSSSTQYPLLIGGAPDYNSGARNFYGNLAQVAVFTNALTGAQINSLYAGAGGAPATVSLLTASVTVNEGDSTNLTATAGGSPTLYYQWYYQDTSSTTYTIAGATNLTLNLNNVSFAQNGNQYYIVASNDFGTATSTMATLNVNHGAPVIANDVTPVLSESPTGVSDQFSVVVTGSEPFIYHWLLNSTPIAGATNSSYAFTVASGTNSYSVIVSNAYGVVSSSVAQVIGLSTAPPVIGFGDGSMWQLNSAAGAGAAYPVLTNGTLVLTDGNNSEASSAFYIIPQYADGFVTTFTYTTTNGSADGTTFVVQDSSAGTNALGGGGGDLGLYGINNSVAFELNLYSGANGGTGIAFGAGGATPDSPVPLPPYLPTSPVNIASGDPINVRLACVGGVMYAKLTDATTSATYSVSHKFGDLTPILGNSSGYVGFTGATGGLNAVQAVSNFQFTYSTPPVLTSLSVTNNNAVIRWPVSVSPLFVVQKASVASGPYTTIAGSPTIVSGANQISVPVTGTQQFFRLALP